jgi:hypothetical protein
MWKSYLLDYSSGLWQASLLLLLLPLSSNTRANEPIFKPTGIYAEKSLAEQFVERIDAVKKYQEKEAKNVPLTSIDQSLGPQSRRPKENYHAYSPWYVDGHNTSDSHLIHTHGVSPETLKGLTQDEKNRLHGKMHGEQARVSMPIVRQTQSGGCPNGVCPLNRRR